VFLTRCPGGWIEGIVRQMRARAALTLIALFILCIIVGKMRVENVHANETSSNVIERAIAADLKSASNTIPAQDKAEPTQVSHYASPHLEPLLLLLLGSTLLALGTAINLVLSKRMKAKSLRSVASNR